MTIERTRIALALIVLGLGGACARTPRSNDAIVTGSTDGRSEASPLDVVMRARWEAKAITPAPIASDAEFLRRLSLDLVGRPPTREEVETFLADESTGKRVAVVDRLLADPGFARRLAETLRPVLFGGNRKVEKVAGDRALEWLEGELARGVGWDEIVDQMLTAEGDLRSAPASAFLASRLRRDDYARLTSDTSREFLGVSIECAQCHDHPYEDFTVADFRGMSAFWARTRARREGGKGPNFTLSDRPRGELRVEGEIVEPTFLGEPVEIADNEARRAALSRLVRGSDRFAEAAVERVASELFGRPFEDPALIGPVAAEFRRSDHDLRALVRTLVLTEAYQRSSVGGSAPEGVDPAEHFARAAIRPLDADRLFRSIVSVTGLESVETPRVRRLIADNREQAKRELELVFADDEQASVDSFTGNVPQALLLLNGVLSNESVVSRPGSTLDAILSGHRSSDERLRALTLTVYGRPPGDAERAALRSMALAGDDTSDPKVWEDLMFAMLFSTEFHTNH